MESDMRYIVRLRSKWEATTVVELFSKCYTLITYLSRVIFCGINISKSTLETDWRQRNPARYDTDVKVVARNNSHRRSHRASLGSSWEQTLKLAEVTLREAVDLIVRPLISWCQK
jgi:hypothetical protein